MPLANYRGSEEAILHEIHEVTGRRQFAKQVLGLPHAAVVGTGSPPIHTRILLLDSV